MIQVVFFLAVFFIAGCGAPKPTSSLDSADYWFYTKAERIETLESFRGAIKRDYALIDIKKRRLGIDTDVLFNAAIDFEKQLEEPENDVSAQAAANMAFLDRMRELVAKYQDTHFGIKPVTARPTIINGLNVQEVQGEIFITSITPAILDASGQEMNDENIKKIGVGDKVLEIDGKKPLDYAKELVPYENGSSPGYSLLSAVASMVSRDYAYPQKNFSDWKVESIQAGKVVTVRLPWYYDSKILRSDSLRYLQDRRFRSLENLKLTYDPMARKWSTKDHETKGLKRSEAPKGAIGTKVWKSTLDMMNGYFRTIPCLRTGYLIKEGKVYPFIQVYHYIMLEVEDEEGTKLAWEKVVQNFIQEIRERGASSLIIDLRDNPGGITSNPAKLMAAISKPADSYPTFHRAFRITRHIKNVVNQNSDDPIFTDGRLDFDQRSREVVQQTFARGAEYSFAVPASEPIKAVEENKGFEGKIVAMITPKCVSSCDITAILFEASQRVTLIGTHASGTGAGATSVDGISTDFTDPSDIFQTTMLPNMLFGYPLSKPEDSKNPDAYYELNSENRPVTVSDQNKYEPTLKDYTEQSVDWYNKAISMIGQ